MSVDRIAANLAAFRRRAADRPGRAAAVAICVLGVATDPHVLVIKRAPRGRNAGQWALPGGRSEPAEDAVTTALRELHEEVGVVAGPGHVAGLLDDFVTDSGFVITPIVVLPPEPVELTPNPTEVDSVHRIGFDRLLAADLPRWRVDEDGRRLLYLPLRRDMVVHAPTGAILWQFRDVALLGRDTRVYDADQPAFTRT